MNSLFKVRHVLQGQKCHWQETGGEGLVSQELQHGIKDCGNEDIQEICQQSGSFELFSEITDVPQ